MWRCGIDHAFENSNHQRVMPTWPLIMFIPFVLIKLRRWGRGRCEQFETDIYVGKTNLKPIQMIQNIDKYQSTVTFQPDQPEMQIKISLQQRFNLITQIKKINNYFKIHSENPSPKIQPLIKHCDLSPS